MRCDPSLLHSLTVFMAARVHHDPLHAPQREEHRQILVRRKLPFAFVPRIITHFAGAYVFQYELVTHQWPLWLCQQKKKQFIIWMYRILFLDVLFPMDVKKAIFVDADLKELVGLDLHGAPCVYTRMGDDNPEMEAFRF